MAFFDYPDHEFDLMSIGNDELFAALKNEVLNMIKNIQVL
jgi:hypothetical protein